MLTLSRLHGVLDVSLEGQVRPIGPTRSLVGHGQPASNFRQLFSRQMAYSATTSRAKDRTFHPNQTSNRRQGPLSKPKQKKASFFNKKPTTIQTEAPTTHLTSELMSSLESAMQKSTLDPADPSLAGIEERVAKRIARCGLCSRREAEKWITEGRVKVDGQLVLEPGTTVRPGQVLAVDDIPIRAEPPKLFIFNKVRNMLITRSLDDEKKRETLGQLLNEMGEPTLLPVGRLDYTSEGLLLLTNDGELKRYLEHPDSNIQRTYRVRIYGRVTQDRFRGLEKGIMIDGFAYRGVKVTVENAAERPGKRPEPQRNVEHVPPPELRANTWLRVELHEGKNREIRRIMEHFGLEVSRLIRIQYGPYKLSREIESGVVAPVPILDELKPHTNQAWNWHPKQEAKPSLAERLKMPKSNEPPRRKKQATSKPMEEPL